MSLELKDIIPEAERLEWQEWGVDVEKLPKNRAVRQQLLEFNRRERSIPKWVRISGLYPEMDDNYQREQRRKRVRALIQAAAWLTRRELKFHETDPDKDERSVYWDPLSEVCRELGIARSKLSFYCRELNGLSATQMVDCIRVEQAPKQMREELRAFLKSFLEKRTAHHGNTETLSNTSTYKELTTLPGPLPETGSGGLPDRWEVWKALKAARRYPEFNHGTWAMGYGFSSYTRFYRACLVIHKASPHQLEMEIIDELLQEAAGKQVAFKHDLPVQSLEEIQAKITEFMPKEILMEPWRVWERKE
jgi:AraC-like DNA-binding protein